MVPSTLAYDLNKLCSRELIENGVDKLKERLLDGHHRVFRSNRQRTRLEELSLIPSYIFTYPRDPARVSASLTSFPTPGSTSYFAAHNDDESLA